MTSPPTGILPPTPIGQSQSSKPAINSRIANRPRLASADSIQVLNFIAASDPSSFGCFA